MYRDRFDRMLRPVARAVGVIGVAAVAALAIAACGGTGGGDTLSPLGVIHQATRTVQLNLIITGSRLNGYSTGQMTVRVPRGWRVDVYCSNQAGTPHSCAIVSGTGAPSLAFSGAASPHPVAGVPARTFANFSFIATRVGSYRVTSLVPGSEDRTMWEHFDVVGTGEPSVSALRSPAEEAVTPQTKDGRNS